MKAKLIPNFKTAFHTLQRTTSCELCWLMLIQNIVCGVRDHNPCYPVHRLESDPPSPPPLPLHTPGVSLPHDDLPVEPPKDDDTRQDQEAKHRTQGNDESGVHLVCNTPSSPGLSTICSSDCLLAGCLTSQQHASVSQGRICSDHFTCCHTEIEIADPTFYLTQSQYTDTGPTSPSADPITPGAWQGIHWSANF